MDNWLEQFAEYIQSSDVKQAYSRLISVSGFELQTTGARRPRTVNLKREGRITYAFTVNREWLGFYICKPTVSAGWAGLQSELLDRFGFRVQPSSGHWVVKVSSVDDVEVLEYLSRKTYYPLVRLARRADKVDPVTHREPPLARPQGPWIDRLIESDVFAAQKKQAARTALSETRIRTILAELDRRGGKLTAAALAQSLGVPRFRLGGMVSALRRMLNVDGYDVLSVDEASDTVELNRELLEIQFGLVHDGK